MKKQEFVEKFMANLEKNKVTLNKKETTLVIDEFISLIVKTLKGGDEVVFPDLGKFLVKKRPARTARNPITGESVKVPAKIVPQFRASKKFKTEVVG